MAKDKVYKNAPLVDAIFEIRFPGEPVVENRRDIFFEKIRIDFPNVFVPNVQPGVFPALEPYQYMNDEKSMTIMTAINRFSISTKKYTGFNSFKEKIIELTKKFNESYNLKNINRVGVRYINVIPFVSNNGIIPLKDYLNIEFKLPDPIPNDFKNLNLAFTSKIETGSITTKIASMKSEKGADEALLLDFDFAKDSDLKMSNIKRYLEEGHLITKKLFEEFITVEYRTFIEGEVI